MEFRILGPLEVLSGGARLDLGGVRNQKVLAALLLSAGRVATLPYLVDVVWGDNPPSTSKHQIHKSIGELRGLLGADVIVTDRAGYRLEADELDQRTFEDLVSQVQHGPAEQAVERLRSALGLWRGPALAGLTGEALQADIERLEERRMAVLERCLSLELELGRHRDVVGELTSLVAAHPFRERLAELLMMALYLSGRQAEALGVYQETRRRLADDLGVEPGASLRAAHQSVLNQERGGTQQPSTPTPAQLPADLARFTGRQDQLDELDRLLVEGAGTVVITAIGGIAGVGKTALAVHWAHRVRDRFPDGQLYVNLRGYDEAPATTPSDALAQFLRAFGVDSIPAELDERAAVFRSLVAHRRMLIVLDNAASEQQVRPLLPGTPHCAVVITSRTDLRGLAALDDAHQVLLDVLTPDESHQLIGRVLGERRAAAETDAVAELARLCGHLPLAIRIAVANLVGRPNGLVADAVTELTEGNRLAKLAIRGDERAAVAAAFELSYRALPDDARLLFRRLGLLPRSDFTVRAAEALVGGPVCEGISVLERANLIEPHTQGRHRMHDLVRLYAQDLVRDDFGRDEAWRRLLEFYLQTADIAMKLLAPDMFRLDRTTSAPRFSDRASALSWLDDERESMVTAVLQCAEDGPYEFAWHLTDVLRGYFWMRRLDSDCALTGSAALRVAQLESDVAGQAVAHSALGTACMEQYHEQCEHWRAAREFYRAAGNPRGEFHALHNLGTSHNLFGRPMKSVEVLTEALALAEDDARKSLTHTSVGVSCLFAGKLTTAVHHLECGLEHARAAGGELRQVPSLIGLADVSTLLGRLDLAHDCADRARRLTAESGSRTWLLNSMRSDLMLLRDTDQCDEAERTAMTLVALAEESATNHYVLSASDILGQLYLHTGRHARAIEVLEHGLALAQATQKPHYVAMLLTDLARVRCATGDTETASDDAKTALDLARDCGLRAHEGRALTTLALVHSGPFAEQALEVQLETGHLLGQAEALFQLGRDKEAGKIIAHFTGSPQRVPAGTLGGGRTVSPCHRS